MRTILLTIALASVFLVVAVIFYTTIQKPEEYKMVEVKIGEKVLKVEIADTPALQLRGLSGRNSLAEDAGMLFIFPKAETRQFWMKGMRFPIDIIWISEDRVVGIVLDAESESGPEYTIYTSPEPADKVLEINAGLSQQLGIKIGDIIN